MFHQQHVESFRAKYNDLFYAIFRVMIGVLFMFHGAQKLFGLFTDNSAQPIISMMGAAGIIEFFGGLLIALGLLTVPVAIIAAVEMIAAFFMSHFTLANPIPILNRGELALLYMAAFLYIIFEGSGRYSVDTRICAQCKTNNTPLAVKK